MGGFLRVEREMIHIDWTITTGDDTIHPFPEGKELLA